VEFPEDGKFNFQQGKHFAVMIGDKSRYKNRKNILVEAGIGKKNKDPTIRRIRLSGGHGKLVNRRNNDAWKKDGKKFNDYDCQTKGGGKKEDFSQGTSCRVNVISLSLK